MYQCPVQCDLSAGVIQPGSLVGACEEWRGKRSLHAFMHKYLGPRNLTLLARLFLNGRHAQAWDKTKYCASDLMQQYHSA